jgi:hypothetical protein
LKRAWIALLVGLIAVLVAAVLMAFQTSVQAASLPKGDARIDLIVDIGPGTGGKSSSIEQIMKAVSDNDNFVVDSFFDVSYVSNIGSSGLDGFTVDSFFDIEYRIVGSFDTEMVALSLTGIFGDPDFDLAAGAALDAVREAVTAAGGTTHYGHVTVLK